VQIPFQLIDFSGPGKQRPCLTGSNHPLIQKSKKLADAKEPAFWRHNEKAQ
jgi:hypothetical protein